MKAKTQFYIMVVSLVFSLLGMAILRFGGGGTPHRTLTPTQQLHALENTSSQSADMRQFIQREEVSEQAKQEAADALPK